MSWSLSKKYKIINGVYWIGVPQANVFVLCGCPEEIVKHLMKKGFNKTIQKQGVTYETGPQRNIAFRRYDPKRFLFQSCRVFGAANALQAGYDIARPSE